MECFLCRSVLKKERLSELQENNIHNSLYTCSYCKCSCSIPWSWIKKCSEKYCSNSICKNCKRIGYHGDVCDNHYIYMQKQDNCY